LVVSRARRCCCCCFFFGFSGIVGQQQRLIFTIVVFCYCYSPCVFNHSLYFVSTEILFCGKRISNSKGRQSGRDTMQLKI
jgi:hypothetical protein